MSAWRADIPKKGAGGLKSTCNLVAKSKRKKPRRVGRGKKKEVLNDFYS